VIAAIVMWILLAVNLHFAAGHGFVEGFLE
jgi:hypothetical protein